LPTHGFLLRLMLRTDVSLGRLLFAETRLVSRDRVGGDMAQPGSGRWFPKSAPASSGELFSSVTDPGVSHRGHCAGA
jgi:hypothetical protein